MTQVTNQHTIFKFTYNVKNHPSKQYYTHSEVWLSINDFLNRKIKQFSLFLYLVILQHEICIFYQPCTNQLSEALPSGTSPRERKCFLKCCLIHLFFKLLVTDQ